MKNSRNTLLQDGMNWIAARKVAETVTTMLPMVGMKFRRKVRIPQTRGKSIPLMRAVR